MVETNLKIINELKSFLQTVSDDSAVRGYFTSNSKDFSRNRSLTLPRLVSLLINMPKRSLSIEINDFFELLDTGSVTKSALSIQRGKLLPIFFEVWNDFLVECFYHYYGENIRRWRGLRLLAGDGSTVNLVDRPEVLDHFGSQSNQHVKTPMARTLQLYDVLNDMTFSSRIVPVSHSENVLLLNCIRKLDSSDLLILDRCFPSYELMYLLQNQETAVNFVMRAKNDFNNLTKQFLKSSKDGKTLDFYPSPKAIKGLRLSGFIVDKRTPLKIRMVRIVLPSGETELLLTNLYDVKQYTNADIYTLYGLRWGVETSFDTQKNQLQLEQFSGHRVICILQDFYAHMFVLNLQSLIAKQCEQALECLSENRMYNYKLNRNICWGSLKNRIVRLFLQNNILEILNKLQSLFMKSTEPIRPGRSNPRIKKLKLKRRKYNTLTNYKRAI